MAHSFDLSLHMSQVPYPSNTKDLTYLLEE